MRKPNVGYSDVKRKVGNAHFGIEIVEKKCSSAEKVRMINLIDEIASCGKIGISLLFASQVLIWLVNLYL